MEAVGLGKDYLKTQYRHVAEKQARRHLLLAKIIEQESLELTEEEMEKGFEEMAIGMKATVDGVKNFFDMKKDQLEYFKHHQLEKKAVDIIIEVGNLTEISPEEAQAAQDARDAEAAKAVEAAAAAGKAEAETIAGEDVAQETTQAATEPPAADTTA